MQFDNEWIGIIISRRNLETSCMPKPVAEHSDFYIIESINVDTSNDEVLLIHDCRNSNLEYDKFSEIENKKDETFQPVVIFQNWDQEREKYWSYYNTLTKASDRKAFSEWFSKKISIYTDCISTVTLELRDDGINFLEYNNTLFKEISERNLKGCIYNVSFFELKKLFNVTGAHLFANNVRYGLKKHQTGERLKVKFREYICVSLYNVINKKLSLNSSQKDFLSEILEVEVGENGLETASLPENFWFYHNGVTIFCYDDSKLETPANKIKLSPSHVSVINGAQTLTNFYSELESIERSMIDEIRKEFEKDIPDFDYKTLLSSVTKEIFVKTIIICGNSEYVRPITYGLNTQIPILEEGLLASSEIVEDINNELNRYSFGKLKILKDGEQWSGETGISVLDFAKHWWTISGEPGKSKNLGKRHLERDLTAVNVNLKENSNQKIQELLLLLDVYQWWEDSKNIRQISQPSTSDKDNDSDTLTIDENNTSIGAINRYGKNYFGAYVVKSATKIEQIDDSKMILLYEQFTKDLLETGMAVTLGEFKKDELSKRMFESQQLRKNELSSVPSEPQVDQAEKMQKDITGLLNKEDQNVYTFSKTISQYLLSEKINIDYFRVISLADGKCKEAFPFPNSTFNEISSIKPDETKHKNKKYKSFEKSLFYTELQRIYSVFIVNKDTLGKIESVVYVPKFSFDDAKIIGDAKQAYNLTINAFKSGNESEFPKSSSGMSFHIRPKAANADDTFEFSNGDFITKRTFWANKETVENMLAICKNNAE